MSGLAYLTLYVFLNTHLDEAGRLLSIFHYRPEEAICPPVVNAAWCDELVTIPGGKQLLNQPLEPEPVKRSY